jgi:uncharacterized delta-60 repeat protein
MRTILLFVSLLCACGPVMTTPDAGGTSDAGTGNDAGSMSAKATGTGEAIVHLNGTFVIGGTDVKPGQDFDFQLVRLFADGGIDRSFGTNGKVTTSWPTFIDPIVADAGFVIEQKTDQVFALAVQGSKLLAAGTVQSQGGRSGFFGVARYSADGVLDTTFGTAGRTQTRQGFGSLAQTIAIRSDGKIYLAGASQRDVAGSPNAVDFGIVRLSAEGAFDTGFGGAQGVMGDFGKNEDARGIAFDGNRVLVGGGDDFVVARYNDDGSLDMSFGTNGVATSTGGLANTFRALSDGTLLLSGSRRTSATPTFVIKLVRYTAAGQLDASFGTAGVLEVQYDSQQNAILSLEVMSDGRFVAQLQGLLGLSATRFSSAGALDTTFGMNGLRPLPVELNILGAGAIPASANHGVIVGDQLYLAHTDLVSRNGPFVVFTSTPL